MPVFSNIYATLRTRRDLTPDELFDLQRQAADLCKLAKLVNRKGKSPALLAPKRVKKPRTNPYGRVRDDGVRVCRLCERPLPHSTHVDLSYHQRLVMSYKGLRVMNALKRKGGAQHESNLKRVRATYYNLAIRRRAEVFKQVAPNTYAKMTPSELERAINSIRDYRGKMAGYDRFPRMIRRRYS